MNKYFNKKNSYIVLLGVAIFLLIVVLLNNVIFPWYVSSTETKIPNVLGLTQEQAIAALRDAKLEPVIAGSIGGSNYPLGTIMKQNPNAGKKVKENRRVYIFVSTGEELVKVPNLRGKSLKDANILLVKAGLLLGRSTEGNSEAPIGLIFAQSLSEGTAVKKGTPIDVSISIGSADSTSVLIPEIIGKSLSEAQKLLAEKQLKIGKISYQSSSSLLPNTVLDQYPGQGQKVQPGFAVDVIVTKVESQEKKKEEIIE